MVMSVNTSTTKFCFVQLSRPEEQSLASDSKGALKLNVEGDKC
jgi:hypothetical protein